MLVELVWMLLAKPSREWPTKFLLSKSATLGPLSLKALAEGSTKQADGTSPIKHVVKGPDSSGTFQLARLNEIMTRMRRINESYAGGTPANPYAKGLTDLYLSPERMADIRGFAYNAVGGNTTAASDEYGGAMTDLPESAREEIFRNAGAAEIFGVALHEMNEFGVGKKYNALFNTLADGVTYTEADGTGGETFGATDEIIVGIDNSKGSFVRPIARNAETGSTFKRCLMISTTSPVPTRLVSTVLWKRGVSALDSRAIVGSFLDNDA